MVHVTDPIDETARPIASACLRFGSTGGDDIVTNLSAATRVGDTLFVAGDENLVIERLTRGRAGRWDGHRRFPLSELVTLDCPEEEADIEGLAEADGWLWVLGSHARTRPKPGKKGQDRIDLTELADLKDTRARCVLARIPLVDGDGTLTPVAADGKRRAGLVRQNKRGSKLMEMIAADPLLKPFTRIPAKEGGLDIEGIAVADDRVALGLRGPTICGNALMLETRFTAKRSGRLKLEPPCKRLLDLEGLGVRDLKRRGDDLLILAGPSTAVSGPCALYCWEGWAQDPADSAEQVELHRPKRLLDLPVGRRCDHPEGLALWDDGAILVIHDSPAVNRLSHRGHQLSADIFTLSG